ncbi:MAG: carboxypeptidase-like regulatory domain-containing protein [Cyclobacteriaceae bacterium]
MRSFFFLLSLSGSFFGHACLILFYHNGNQTLVGNHEDWFSKDAAVHVIPPTDDRYGSVVFTFMSEGWAQGGMNDQGLFFDGAYTPFQEVFFDTHTKLFVGDIWQTMLDRCKNVEEALIFLKKYQLPDLEESHIMLADAGGTAVLLGVENGRVTEKNKDGNYLLQTNFNPWQPELSEEPVCKRYQSAELWLTSHQEVGKEGMKSILELTHQEDLTVYSNIYDLGNRTITTYNKRDFDHPIEINLNTFFERGNCLYVLDSLAANPVFKGECKSSENEGVVLQGIVLDEEDSPLPFVSIGFERMDIGTISDPDGTFEIQIPGLNLNDSIQFSSIGYTKQIMAINDLIESSEIILQSEAVVLDEVVVSEKKNFRTGRLGYMKGRDGSLPFDTIQGGGAIAMLLSAPEVPFYVDKVQVRLMYNSKDTLQFRLHFFAYDSVCDCPGVELLEKEVILREQRRFGWLRFDLRQEEIRIGEKNFFVGFEWLDDRKTRNQMIAGLRDWNRWKEEEYRKGNEKVELIEMESWSNKDRRGAKDSLSTKSTYYKYHGNMMNWPGWDLLPPFSGLMVETGKSEKTEQLRTFERRTSFGAWIETGNTLNTVVIISY